MKIDLNAFDLVNSRDKTACGDIGESDDHVDQGYPDKRHHRAAGRRADPLFGNFCDRTGSVAHTGGKTHEIVNGTYQDDSERDPEQARQPAKSQTCGNRTRNGACRGDGREVLAKKVKALDRNEILAVVDLVGGRGPFVIKRQQPRDPAPVREIGCGNEDYENSCNDRDAHQLQTELPGPLIESSPFGRL